MCQYLDPWTYRKHANWKEEVGADKDEENERSGNETCWEPGEVLGMVYI